MCPEKNYLKSMSNNNRVKPAFESRTTVYGTQYSKKKKGKKERTRDRKVKGQQERFILLAFNKYLTDFLRKYRRSHVK